MWVGYPKLLIYEKNLLAKKLISKCKFKQKYFKQRDLASVDNIATRRHNLLYKQSSKRHGKLSYMLSFREVTEVSKITQAIELPLLKYHD